MKTHITLCTLLILAGCTQREPAPKAVETTPLQCGRDTDCKADRICEAGTCKTPQSSAAAIKNAPVTQPSIPNSHDKIIESSQSSETKVAASVSDAPAALDRCKAIAFAKSYKTYGEVKWALTKSDDLSPNPPDELSPDTVAGDGAKCEGDTCTLEWFTYRYGSLTITVEKRPGIKETLWPVTKIEEHNNECN